MTRPSRAPTAGDVADLAGVSRATVSYVLSGRRSGTSRISADTRQRVLDAVRALDYAPDSTARALRRRRTERICLVVPRLGVPYYDLLARDLQQAAAEHGYSTVIAACEPGQRASVLEQLRRRLADGVVFVPEVHVPPEEVAALVRLNLAVVVLSDDDYGADVDVIRSNATAACRRAVEYLAGKGHRRIGFIGHFLAGEPHHPRYGEPHYPRYQAYRDGLLANGLPVTEDLAVSGAASRAEAYRSAQRLLALPDRPTAIFAASDIAAVSTIWAARDADLRIPDEVGVIGVGDIPEDAVMHPPLSSVAPGSAASAQIAELLFSRLAGEAPAGGRTYLQEWDLVLRGSA